MEEKTLFYPRESTLKQAQYGHFLIKMQVGLVFFPLLSSSLYEYFPMSESSVKQRLSTS